MTWFWRYKIRGLLFLSCARAQALLRAPVWWLGFRTGRVARERWALSFLRRSRLYSLRKLVVGCHWRWANG